MSRTLRPGGALRAGWGAAARVAVALSAAALPSVAQPVSGKAEAAPSIASVPDGLELDGRSAPGAAIRDPVRPTLLAFSTLWCEVCRRERSALEAWAREHGADARTVRIVSGSGAERVARAARDRDWDPALRTVVDPDGRIAARFGVTATPTLVLLETDGTELRFHRIADAPLIPEARARAGAPGGAGPVTVRDSGEELGTVYDVVVRTDGDPEVARADLAEARALCRALEARLSEWKPDSEISRVNREAAAGPVTLSETLRRLLEGAALVSDLTGGAFDLTWRPLGDFWDAAEALQRWPSAAEIEAARQPVDWRGVLLTEEGVRFRDPRARLGIAGVAKGWIIDAVFLHLRGRGYADIVVNIGGDLRTRGDASGGFSIPDPWDAEAAAIRLDVRDTALATSGNYLRRRAIAGRTVGHVVDPRSGRPPEFDGSVTVATRDAAMADALATALLVLGPDEGLALVETLPGVEAVFVERGGWRASSGIAGSVHGIR